MLLCFDAHEMFLVPIAGDGDVAVSDTLVAGSRPNIHRPSGRRLE